MSNIDGIISLVKEQLSKYDTMNVLDEDLMYRDVVLAVKSFGNNATIDFEDVIQVENGMGKLPDNFYRLYEARLCSPIAYERNNKEFEIHTVMDTQYYNLIHELKTSWNECEDCCKETDMRVFKKELVFKENRKITCNYHKDELLILTKPTLKNYCENGCINYHPECTKEISIHNGTRLTANFKEGDVYIKYKGFPLDEEGNFDFEDTPNGHIEKFLEYDLKVNCAERLASRGVTDMLNMLQYFSQKRAINKKLATNELKLKTLQPKQFANRMELMNRQEYEKLSLGRKR